MDSPEIPTGGVSLALVHSIDVVPVTDPTHGTRQVTSTCIEPLITELIADGQVS